jgi:hypothetical protein
MTVKMVVFSLVCLNCEKVTVGELLLSASGTTQEGSTQVALNTMAIAIDNHFLMNPSLQ